MPESTGYLCAYEAKFFRRFPSWTEQIDTVPPITGEEPIPITDDTVLYLHDTYVVTGGIDPDEHIVFNAVTDAWTQFCHDELGVSVPEIDSEL